MPSRQRDHRGEIAAGAVAADQKPPRVDAELPCVSSDPCRCGDGVLDGGGKFMLGGAAVIDGYHDELTFDGQFSAGHVMALEIADHPAAAVEKHQAARQTVCLSRRLRRVDPRRNRSVRGGNRKRLDRFQFGRIGIGDEAGLKIIFARLLWRKRLISRAAGLLKRLEHGGGIGVEGDGHNEKTLQYLNLSFPGSTRSLSSGRP